jgi:putative phosphonate metabolism protein
MSLGRYGVYYAPPRWSDFERFGTAWLGRDAETGEPVTQPDLPGLGRDVLRELTVEPRRYGFHGTLMAPFEPAEGVGEAAVRERLDRLAATLAPLDMEPLAVRAIGSFLALVPAYQDGPAELAEAVLRAMHPLRAPVTEADRARRRANGLTPAQDRLLEQWGYPYVLGEFRFHITLTGRVADPGLRERIAGLARCHAATVTGRPHPVRELCLFHQPDRETPFRLIHRARLGNTSETS